MTGIALTLRRLNKNKGPTQIFLHAPAMIGGPWLITFLTLGVISLLCESLFSFDTAFLYQTILFNNFSLSLPLCSPIFFIATRYVSDAIIQKKPDRIPGTLITSLFLLYLYMIPIALFVHLFKRETSYFLSYQAILNLLLLSTFWILFSFLNALFNYWLIIFSLLIGFFFNALSSVFLYFPFGTEGMLFGFNLGIGLLCSLVAAVILGMYPYRSNWPKGFTAYFKEYQTLALSGGLVFASFFIDKWILCFSTCGETTIFGLDPSRIYNSSMLMSTLSIIPIMTLSVMKCETLFFKSYLSYFRTFHEKTDYLTLEKKKEVLFERSLEIGRNFLILQGIFTALVLFISPILFEILNINFLQLGIFRFGTLGVFFNALILFTLIISFSFDFRRFLLGIPLAFFFSNLIFSYVSMKLGFPYYGSGYFFSSSLIFLLASVWVISLFKNLNYQVFIKNSLCRR